MCEKLKPEILHEKTQIFIQSNFSPPDNGFFKIVSAWGINKQLNIHLDEVCSILTFIPQNISPGVPSVLENSVKSLNLKNKDISRLRKSLKISGGP